MVRRAAWAWFRLVVRRAYTSYSSRSCDEGGGARKDDERAMLHSLKCFVAGSLALAELAVTTAEVEAMPVQPLGTAATTSSVEHVWWRGGYGYGYRRPFFGYGYGFRRPFYGYGFRRPFFGYGFGWRRPLYGYRRW